MRFIALIVMGVLPAVLCGETTPKRRAVPVRPVHLQLNRAKRPRTSCTCNELSELALAFPRILCAGFCRATRRGPNID